MDRLLTSQANRTKARCRPAVIGQHTYRGNKRHVFSLSNFHVRRISLGSMWDGQLAFHFRDTSQDASEKFPPGRVLSGSAECAGQRQTPRRRDRQPAGHPRRWPPSPAPPALSTAPHDRETWVLEWRAPCMLPFAPLVPVATPYGVLVLGAAELELDRNDVGEALGRLGLLEAGSEAVEGELGQGLARLRVHGPVESPHHVVVLAKLERRLEPHTTYGHPLLLSQGDPLATSVGVGICVVW